MSLLNVCNNPNTKDLNENTAQISHRKKMKEGKKMKKDSELQPLL